MIRKHIKEKLDKGLIKDIRPITEMLVFGSIGVMGITFLFQFLGGIAQDEILLNHIWIGYALTISMVTIGLISMFF